MTALNDIRTQLDQASSVIDGYRRVIADGTPVALDGLDGDIAAICHSISKLPADERPALKGALIALMDDMDALVRSLQEQQEALATELKGLSSRRQAVSAYGRSEGNIPRKGGPKK